MRLEAPTRIELVPDCGAPRTALQSDPTELVYFAQAGNGPIKIGCTRSTATISNRINTMQVNNHLEITLLGWFTVPLGHERLLHARLAQHRIRGEWFAPHTDVLDALEACEFVSEDRT